MSPIQRALVLLMAREQLTNEDLATRSGVDVSTIKKLADGSYDDPPVSTLLRLADALGVTVNTMVYPTCIEVRVVAPDVKS